MNTPVFTTRKVFAQEEPVLLVAHDDDGAWQFHGLSDFNMDNNIAVCPFCAVDLFGKVTELADLPAGWIALRSGELDKWEREPQPPVSGSDE
jgi:hypothetical protein